MMRTLEQEARIERLTAENERLRNRNAALVESLRAHRCLVDGRANVGECQQCGCIDGLLISGDTQQQAVNTTKDRGGLCPNCGDQTAIDRAGRCTNCGQQRVHT